MTDKPRPCPAGHEVKIKRSGLFDSYFVGCREPDCWDGPYRKTEDEAIAAWNHCPTEDALRARAEEAESKLAEAEKKIADSVSGIPQGAKLARCYEADGKLVILGDPTFEDHSCDYMGCAQEHVLARVALSDVEKIPAMQAELAEAKRQAAAMREALEEIQHTCKIPREDLVLHQVDKSMCAVVAECALQHDAGRDYVPRAELEAAQKRVAELEAQVRWTPVGEGLPPNEMETLILHCGYAFSAVFRTRSNGEQYWTRSGVTYYIGKRGVTHWMLIPQAPEVKPC